jgi:hypothetical protein
MFPRTEYRLTWERLMEELPERQACRVIVGLLDRWTHHYNWHRSHLGIGGLAPVSRLAPEQK